MAQEKTTTIFLRPNGEIAFLHDDLAASLVGELGVDKKTRRASHVEPDEDGNWYADLSPVGGPTFGPFPNDQRDAALAAEAAWLERNYLPEGRLCSPT